MASTYLARAHGSSTNTKQWSVSVWLKRGKLGYQCSIWGTGNSSGYYTTFLMFNASDQLRFGNLGSGSPLDAELITNRTFKDTNAWYHIVVGIDSDQSTDSNRVKIYVNGEQETSFATTNYPSQGAGFRWNEATSTSGPSIGRTGHWDDRYFDGCMSHIHLIDGTQYAASDFGETDATTGEWKIKTSPSVTYGTNGAFILKDGNSGTDQSGNSNNWTVGGGTLTKTEDNPSNSFATGNPHYWTNSAWNSATLTNGNNVFGGSISTDTYAGIWSSLVMPRKGKYYTEFKITAGSSGGGNAYVGIATPESVNEASNAGKYSGYQNMGGNHGHEYSIYGSDGQKYVKENGGSQTGSTYGSNVTFGTNDIICIACDLDNNKLYFRKNGDAWMNSGNPESGSTGTGALSIINHDYHMFICDGGGGTFINADANFGNGYFGTTAVSSAGTNASNHGIFEYDVPAGYTALCTKGLNSF